MDGKLWQRNYYEHIIRNERDLQTIREYIATNPVRWETDWENILGAEGRPRRPPMGPCAHPETGQVLGFVAYLNVRPTRNET